MGDPGNGLRCSPVCSPIAVGGGGTGQGEVDHRACRGQSSSNIPTKRVQFRSRACASGRSSMSSPRAGLGGVTGNTTVSIAINWWYEELQVEGGARSSRPGSGPPSSFAGRSCQTPLAEWLMGQRGSCRPKEGDGCERINGGVAASGPTTIDVPPHPRLLSVLGDIEFQPWQCIAELVDNGFDDFLKSSSAEEGAETPTVQVTLPGRSSSLRDAEVWVRDNGRGMTLERLRNSLRAGWTDNDRFGHLGLFGMGFNIATARLGHVAVVRTTRRGDPHWQVVTIDLRKLAGGEDFRLPGHAIEGFADQARDRGPHPRPQAGTL